MRVFIVGATGFVGDAIARHLNSRGHSVSGLARSPSAASAKRLQAGDIRLVIGDLEQGLDSVLAETGKADAVVFAPQVRPDIERRVVAALLEAMSGTGKTFLFTSGSGVFLQRTGGSWNEDSFAEDDSFVPEPLALLRVETEKLVHAASDHGVRGIVVRPPLIWGPGDHGHIAMVYRSIALTGAACYVGDGLAVYSHVHVEDVCRLFVLALERGVPGSLYHAVGGEVPNRWIAEAVARDMHCSSRSLSMEEASEVWGEFGALIMSASSRARAPRSRRELGWEPRKMDMLSMIGEPRLKAMSASQS